MIPVYINSIGLAAPGLMGWADSQPVLRNQQAYLPEDMPRLVPKILPPNERRRATRTIRLALEASQEAMEHSTHRADQVASVFASSDGDAELLDSLCTALAKENPVVSPFEFHNSVHNAPAGYWAIATGSHGASTSICTFDDSFSSGLIETVTQSEVDQIPVLLVAYDQPLPPPLDAKRHLAAPFAAALLISPAPGQGDLVRLSLSLESGEGGTDPLADPELERLRQGNAAARSLPLLTALARGEPDRIAIPHQQGTRLVVELNPC